MQARSPAPARQCGLVLLEVLVAGCVLALLAALAAPSFAAVSERLKVRTAVDSLSASLYAARAEALKRGGYVSLSKDSGADCQGTLGWSCGWTAFVDDDEDGRRDDGEELLFIEQPPPGIEITQTRKLSVLKLNAWGQFNGLGALGFVLRSRASAKAVSVICISSGGRLQSWFGEEECPG